MNLLRLFCCMFPLLVAALDTITLVQPQQEVDETAGGVDYLVARYGTGSGAVSVDILITPSGAVLNTDYAAPQPPTLTWASGDLLPKVVHLPILATAGFQYQRGLTLGLSNVSGAVLGVSWPSVGLEINDVDPDPAGVLVVLADDPQGNVATRDDVGVLHLGVLRSGGTQGVQSITFGLANYDTQAGVDYASPASTVLNWAAGEGGVKTLDLSILPRSQARGTRTLYALRSSATSIPIGQGWTVAIADHLPTLAGTLAVPASVSALETAGSATVTVGRSGGSSGAVSVHWAIIDDALRDDAALVGVNYGSATVSGTLSWADGDGADKSISIPLIDDGLPRPTLSSCIAFSNPTGGLLITMSPINGNPLPGQAGCMLDICDDDHQGLLGFTTTAATVNELAGSVTFSVSRSGGTAGAISVDFTTSNANPGDAIAGTDYTTTTGTLQWPAGNASPQSITVPIMHAAGTQPDRWFGILLFHPQNGAGIDDGTPARSYAQVTIQDVDGGALDTIAPVSATASVHETAGSVSLAFVRSGSGVGPAGVQIIMQAGSAYPVLQYGTPSASALTWASGEVGSKILTVPILHDGVAGPSVDFTVFAGVTYGNAALAGLNNHTTVTILNDDAAVAGTSTGSATAAGGGGCGAGATACLGLGLILCMRWRRPRPLLA